MLPNLARVDSLKILGLIFSRNLSASEYVSSFRACCVAYVRRQCVFLCYSVILRTTDWTSTKKIHLYRSSYIPQCQFPVLRVQWRCLLLIRSDTPCPRAEWRSIHTTRQWPVVLSAYVQCLLPEATRELLEWSLTRLPPKPLVQAGMATLYQLFWCVYKVKDCL